MIAKRYQNGTYTVLSPETGEIVALQESRETALERGVSEVVLDTQVSDAEWRNALMTCTTATAAVCKDALAGVATSDEVRDKFTLAMAAVTTLSCEVAEQHRQSEIRTLREFQESELKRLIGRFESEGRNASDAVVVAFRQHLATTRAGRRLAALEAQ